MENSANRELADFYKNWLLKNKNVHNQHASAPSLQNQQSSEPNELEGTVPITQHQHELETNPDAFMSHQNDPNPNGSTTKDHRWSKPEDIVFEDDHFTLFIERGSIYSR
jgi:hypothetical protein